MKREYPVQRIVLVAAICLVAGAFGTVPRVWAQQAGIHVLDTADEKVLRITVHAAEEPRPALKYQLLPRFLDRTPGNAAVHYGKVTAAQTGFFGNDDLQLKISEWNSAPLDELPRDEVRKAVERKSILDSLRRAARCNQCDWQLPIREGNVFAMLIPEAQESRAFARLLAARARLQIAEGKYDEAVETLQMNYALAQHVAQGETLIHGLIGIAISGITSNQITTLIQQPDAPNLYWALTKLPRPLIDAKQGIEAEMYSVHLSFADLENLDDMTRSPGYWHDSLKSLWKQLGSFDSDHFLNRPEVLTALALKGYPDARRALIKEGYPQEQVDAMPVSQVLLIYTRLTFEVLRDDIFKWFQVPYYEAQEGMNQAEERLKWVAMQRKEVIPLASMFLPAVRAVQGAIARCEREIAVLRTIEALRLYAAKHDGQLPEKLSDLTVPVPLDPFTGKPFEYELRKSTAVITGPPVPGMILHLEVTVAKS